MENGPVALPSFSQTEEHARKADELKSAGLNMEEITLERFNSVMDSLERGELRGQKRMASGR